MKPVLMFVLVIAALTVNAQAQVEFPDTRDHGVCTYCYGIGSFITCFTQPCPPDPPPPPPCWITGCDDFATVRDYNKRLTAWQQCRARVKQQDSQVQTPVTGPLPAPTSPVKDTRDTRDTK